MSSTDLRAHLSQNIIALIRGKRKIAILTGAGISAEAGLATFRGKDGLWAKMRAEELASIQGFMANPQLVWEWYQHRRDVLSSAQPASGHRALAEWERSHDGDFTLITQNVDGLHRLAGSSNVLELHGNIRVTRCFKCGREPIRGVVEFRGEELPKCSCGGLLRPGVVWFGEMLPEPELTRAFEAAEQCDLFLTIGTSSQVYPAASLPVVAKEHGATVIEINPEETPFTPHADIHLSGGAGDILSAMVLSLSAI